MNISLLRVCCSRFPPSDEGAYGDPVMGHQRRRRGSRVDRVSQLGAFSSCARMLALLFLRSAWLFVTYLAAYHFLVCIITLF